MKKAKYKKNNRQKIDFIGIAKSVLEIEIDSIKTLAGSLGDSFIEAVEAIARCRGRIILTGMGKSGIICRKIAATLTSTGTQAVFMHPSEALHGDLGLIKRKDIVIAISNSGETREIRVTR